MDSQKAPFLACASLLYALDDTLLHQLKRNSNTRSTWTIKRLLAVTRPRTSQQATTHQEGRIMAAVVKHVGCSAQVF